MCIHYVHFQHDIWFIQLQYQRGLPSLWFRSIQKGYQVTGRWLGTKSFVRCASRDAPVGKTCNLKKCIVWLSKGHTQFAKTLIEYNKRLDIEHCWRSWILSALDVDHILPSFMLDKKVMETIAAIKQELLDICTSPCMLVMIYTFISDCGEVGCCDFTFPACLLRKNN